jgi:DNA-binding MarR family transcriptional regulator
MATGDLPEQVRYFIRRHVESVLDLDILLAIRAADGPRAASELARELRLNETASAAALDKFAAIGLLERDKDDCYVYRPRERALAADADALADAYARRRVSVIRFIYKRPSEGVSAFADAFRLRKDR